MRSNLKFFLIKTRLAVRNCMYDVCEFVGGGAKLKPLEGVEDPDLKSRPYCFYEENDLFLRKFYNSRNNNFK